MNEPSLNQILCGQALEKLAKWRSLFAGWQLGTRPNTDPECQAVRDTRELLIIMRAEVNALCGLLIKTGAIDQEEWFKQLKQEAETLDADYEKRFPGFRTTEVGLVIYDVKKAAETQKGWKP